MRRIIFAVLVGLCAALLALHHLSHAAPRTPRRVLDGAFWRSWAA